LEDYLDRSPVLLAMDRLLIDTFGPIRSTAPLRDASRIAWLPLGIPAGRDAKHYAFEPKQLRDLYQGREEFELDRHWLNPREQLSEMRQLCESAGARLVILFAPTKAHVTFPLAAPTTNCEQVRAFTQISYEDELPAGDEFLAALLRNIDAREQVIGEWCARESIPFLSLTLALRQAVADGVQVYYTYDQHWTPDGHAIVARAAADALALRSGAVDSRP
jgi:hypothetical protein